MILEFGGVKIPVIITEESQFVSKHTGTSLSILYVDITANLNSGNEQLLSVIAGAKNEGIISINEDGSVEKRWKIGKTSWSHREGDTKYYHSVELIEEELLKPSSLTIANITVNPYEYHEEFSNESLQVEAKVRLTTAQHSDLKALEKDTEYVLVTRHGIDENPRQMRFGLCYWSQHDTDYKHELFLTDYKQGEEANKSRSVFEWMWTMRKQVAKNTAAIEAILTILLNRGTLTEEEVATLRQKISESSFDNEYEFFRVKDIDEP